MITVFELLKYLPKTNCGECGEPTCMAFATKVVTSSGFPVTKCPYLDEVPEELNQENEGVERPGPSNTDPETQLLKELREKIKKVDLGAISEDLGAKLVNTDRGVALELPFIDDLVLISREELISRHGRVLDPRDQILLYNYCFFGGSGPVAGEWVGLESFPNSVSKVTTLKRYTEDKLAQAYGSHPTELAKRVAAMGGYIDQECPADLCFEVSVFPKITLRFHFWQADSEEGFEPEVKVLYDRRAIEFLDLESLVFAAERVVEKILNAPEANMQPYFP